MFDTTEMLSEVKRQLAVDLNCAVHDFDGEKDGIVFIDYKQNPGRRPFPRGGSHFEMLSLGQSIIVSATPEIMEIVKPQLIGKSRDEAFSMPFIYGCGVYFLPDLVAIKEITAPKLFEFETVERRNIPSLYSDSGFQNALQYDADHPRPDALAVVAKSYGRTVGIAGASADCEKMWQVGIDVLTEFRGQNIAVYLVNRLTLEILRRGIIPYYGTAVSNIASQRVAHRAGYAPSWICSYKGVFDGADVLPAT